MKQQFIWPPFTLMEARCKFCNHSTLTAGIRTDVAPSFMHTSELSALRSDSGIARVDYVWHSTYVICGLCIREHQGILQSIAKSMYSKRMDAKEKLILTDFLKDTRCYLAGPMECALDCGAEWRLDLTGRLAALGVHVLSPTNKRFKGMESKIIRESSKEHEYVQFLRANQQYRELSDIMKRIRGVDLRLTDIADFIIAYFPKGVVTYGTWEEIFNANRQKKPIFIVWEDGVEAIPLWLWGTLDYRYFYTDFDSLFKNLELLNNGSLVPDDRWKIINMCNVGTVGDL